MFFQYKRLDLKRLIKPIPVLVRIWTNKMEVTRLDSGKSITRNPTYNFSNPRIVLADFNAGEYLLKDILNDMVSSKFGFSRSLDIMIQQMERCEGGLSSVEVMALTDVCRHSGALKVIVIDDSQIMTKQGALFEIAKTK